MQLECKSNMVRYTPFYIYTGWPRKNATLTINNFKKTRDRMKKLDVLLRIKFVSQQTDTKIINFDEGILILWPFSFGGNVNFKICPSKVKSHNLTYRNFSIAWLPRVKCVHLHCKAKPAWIKRIIRSLRNIAALQSGGRGTTQRNSSQPQTWLLIQKEQILKMTLPQKKGSRIKAPSSKSLILV